MRSRCKLHVNKLDDFRAYCIAHGWTVEPAKGFEVLRLRKGRQLATVYRRETTAAGDPPVHYTTWGQSSALLTNFFRSRRHANT